MKSPTPELSRTYPEATDEAWRDLLASSLKNDTDASAVLNKLTRKTLEGIDIRPLYTEEDLNSQVTLQDPRRVSIHQTQAGSSLDTEEDYGGWDIRQTVRETTLADANRVVLDELTQGCNSIHLSVAAPATTVPPAAGSTSAPLVIQTEADLHTLMNGVYLDMVTVSMQPALPDKDLWQWWRNFYQSYNRETGNNKSDAALSSGLESGLQLNGNLFSPITTAVENGDRENFLHIIKQALQSDSNNAQASSLCAVDMTDWHNQGSNNVQDVAIACATGVEYLRLLCDLGLTLADANRQIVFHLSVDTDFFNNIAKLRALRATWHHVLAQCSADQKTSDPLPNLLPRIHAHTSLRMLSTLDADNNQLRNTIACAAAILGGADCISVEAHRPTDAIQPFPALAPSADTRRIARNIQHVLKHESQLHRIQDPLGGSFFIENLTSEMAASAWTLFQEIESKGGMTVNLDNGMLSDLIETNRLQRAEQLAVRKRIQVGVSEFVAPDASVQTGKQSQAENQSQKEVTRIRRDADVFETLRQRTLNTCPTISIDATETTQRQQCLLLCFGSSTMYRARATFARNLLAVAGLDSRDHVLALKTSDKPGTPASTIEQLDMSAIPNPKGSVVVLCADNDSYASFANPLAEQLKDAGASLVILAGKNSDIAGLEESVNWDLNLFMGCNVMALAEDILQTAKMQAGQTNG